MPYVHTNTGGVGYKIVPRPKTTQRRDAVLTTTAGLHFADAAAAARLLAAETALGPRHARDDASERGPVYGGARVPVQYGSGFLRDMLRLGARSIVDEGVKRTPGLSHVRDVVNLLTRFRQKKAGVAPEDAAHLQAAADVYRKERKGAGYEAEHSNDEIAVYHRPTDANPKHRLVAVRGSVNRDDARTDAHLALGRLRKTNRFARSHAHVQALHEKFGPLSFTGHSLGGTLAQAHAANFGEAAGDALGARTVTYNPGAGLYYGKDNNGRVYTVQGDAVSALSHLTHNDVRQVPKIIDDGPIAELNSHGVDQFGLAKK